MSQPSQPAGRPGRYQRSFGGLVGAMIVAVVLVVAFVAFRGAFRENDFDPTAALDYRQTVEDAQRGGLDPIYPPTLPEGWRATSVDLEPGTDDTVWALALLTDDERFVGVEQGGASADDLLAEWLDEDRESQGEVQVDSPLASTWEEFADGGGDTAYLAEVDGQQVLVHGSAPAEDVRTILTSLTKTPIDEGAAPSSSD